MIIYKLTNILTNKSYIGQTIYTLKERWRDHLLESKYKRNNNKLYNSLKKYSKENWITEILEEIFDIELLNEREQYWISFYDTFENGYNSTSGGKQRTKLSEDAKEKCRQSQIGEKSFWFGKKHSEESKRKMKGPKSEEHKAKLRKPKPKGFKEGVRLRALKRWEEKKKNK